MSDSVSRMRRLRRLASIKGRKRKRRRRLKKNGSTKLRRRRARRRVKAQQTEAALIQQEVADDPTLSSLPEGPVSDTIAQVAAADEAPEEEPVDSKSVPLPPAPPANKKKAQTGPKAKYPRKFSEVAGNVHQVGCFPDYAYLHPEFRNKKYYSNGQGKSVAGGPVGAWPDDAKLPKRPATGYLDGVRTVPSIEYMTVVEDNPLNMDLADAQRRCYDMAKSRNKRYFALQNGGLCMATNKKTDFLKWNRLPNQKCKSCPLGTCKAYLDQDPSTQVRKGWGGGGRWTNAVYQIKDMNFGPEVETKELKATFPQEGGADPYANFRFAEPEVKEEMDCPKFADNLFPLSPAQKFAQQYFKPTNPIEGMLIDQSAGSGKSCLALNVVGNFMGIDGWKVVWVTRKSLRAVPNDELYGSICQERVRKLLDLKDKKGNPAPFARASGQPYAGTRTRSEKIDFIRTKPEARRVLKRYGIEMDQQRLMTYGDLVKMCIGRTQKLRDLRAKQERRSPGNNDMGYKTLFVFDEAHNLFTKGLPEDERNCLDKKINSVKFGTSTFKTPADVYGPEVRGVGAQLEGRDAIAAMLYHSYKVSKQDGAKVLLLSATPMSQSPVELFRLMNLMIADPRQRLSLDLTEYYDGMTMQLHEEAIVRFANAAHGRISFYDTGKNPTKFVKKTYFGRVDATLHAFHKQLIREAVEREEKKTKGKKAGLPVRRDYVSLYRNMALAPLVSGKRFHTLSELKAYKPPTEDDWDPQQEEEKQRALYRKEVEAARKAFGLIETKTEQKRYKAKVTKYNAWAAKNSESLKRVVVPPVAIRDVMDPADGTLLSIDQWLKLKGELTEEEESKLPVVDEESMDREHKASRAKRTAAISAYRSISDAYKRWLLASKERMLVAGKLPKVPKELVPYVDQYGQLKSLRVWWLETIEPKKRKPKPKKGFTGAKLKYLPFVIQDPATSLWRIRTEDEFMNVQPPSPTLGMPVSKRKKAISLMMWHKSFDAKQAQPLIEFYSPKVYECIQNILKIEKEAKATYGHGFKHTVFTFSVAGKGAGKNNYGARLVASAFHAFQPTFTVLLVYKKDKNGKLQLRWDEPKRTAGSFGVAVLCSRSLQNIYHGKYKGNKNVDFNATVVEATKNAFNQIENKYGDRIKVLIMDGAYTEGVGAYDTSIAHFLDRGTSRSSLEQASARSARFCRSKNIPFFKGVGGFLDMYFYALKGYQEPNDLYQEMLGHIPSQEKLNVNLIDVFNDLVRQFSIDYFLNSSVNDFNPVYEGTVAAVEPGLIRPYKIAQKLQWSNSGKPGPAPSFDFAPMVDPDSVLTEIKVGSKVVDVQGLMGKVTARKGDGKVEVFTVRDGLSGQSFDRPADDLRLAPGTKVKFHYPYGVDMAQKMMNIGDYNQIGPFNLVKQLSGDLKLPEVAMTATYTVFRSNVSFALLGFVAMLRMVAGAGGAGVPVNIALPADWATKPGRTPTIEDVGLVWAYDSASQVRRLKISDDGSVLDRFINGLPAEAEGGISFMLIYIRDRDGQVAHTNVLVYVKKTRSVERFDPMGYSPFWYESAALDARLYDLFREIDPGIRFMSSAQSNVLFGVNRLQLREKGRHKLDPRSFAAAFSLFYMHMRILDAADSADANYLIYPREFQGRLIQSMKSKFAGELTAYVRNYAENTRNSREFIEGHESYDEDMPFWTNAARVIESLSEAVASRRAVKDIVKQSRALLNVGVVYDNPRPTGTEHLYAGEFYKASAQTRQDNLDYRREAWNIIDDKVRADPAWLWTREANQPIYDYASINGSGLKKRKKASKVIALFRKKEAGRFIQRKKRVKAGWIKSKEARPWLNRFHKVDDQGNVLSSAARLEAVRLAQGRGGWAGAANRATTKVWNKGVRSAKSAIKGSFSKLKSLLW